MNIFASFSQKQIPHFLQKKTFFKRKHDFSRKLEGGTGHQGISSNLNLSIDWLQVFLLVKSQKAAPRFTAIKMISFTNF